MQARLHLSLVFPQADFLQLLLQSDKKENTPDERRLWRAFPFTWLGPRVANSRAFSGPMSTTLLLESVLHWLGAVRESLLGASVLGTRLCYCSQCDLAMTLHLCGPQCSHT